MNTCPVCSREYDQSLGRACSAGCDFAMGTPEDPFTVLLALLVTVIIALTACTIVIAFGVAFLAAL